MPWPTRKAMKKKTTQFAKGPSDRLSVVPSNSDLETHIAFESAIVAAAGYAAVATDAQERAPAARPEPGSAGTPADLLNEDLARVTVTPEAESSARHEFVFLDKRIEGYQTLVDGITAPGVAERVIDVIAIDHTQDGILQISEALRGQAGIDAIHLLGEGTTAELHLGSALLNSKSIYSFYAGAMSDIGSRLSSDAGILIYGCHSGQGETGLGTMQTIARLTQADVATSIDHPGHTSEYGNWSFEVVTGGIEIPTVVPAVTQAEWAGAFSTCTVTDTCDRADAATTTGTLRSAIVQANAIGGTDTIDFDSAGAGPHTIAVLSVLPKITDTMFIDGTAQPDDTGTPDDNAVQGYAFHAEQYPGIDLDGRDPAANGPTVAGTGPHSPLNLPVIDTVATVDSDVTIREEARPGVAAEPFESDEADGDNGEGRTFCGRGSVPLTAVADAYDATANQFASQFADPFLLNADRATESNAVVVRDESDAIPNRNGYVTAISEATANPLGCTGSTTVTIEPLLNLIAIDSLTLIGATIPINGICDNLEDNLDFSNIPVVTGTATGTTGTLLQCGAPSVAGCEATLRNIAHEDSSENPGTAPGTAEAVVSDERGLSVLGTSPIDDTPLNDLPVNATDRLSATMEGAIVLKDSNFAEPGSDSPHGERACPLSTDASGGFEYAAAPGDATADLTHAEICDGQARFENDGVEEAPAYNDSVSDGASPDGSHQAAVVLSNVSDAPVAAAAELAPISEDTADPPGETIANLLAALVTGTDAGESLLGAVVTVNAAPPGEGVWEYSTDSGATWFDIGTVGVNGLALSSSTLVRFVPAADFQGAPQRLGLFPIGHTYAGAFTSGGARQLADTSTNDGASAFGAVPVEVRTLVTPVDDGPPVANGTAIGPAGTDEGTFSGAIAVSSLLAATGWTGIDAMPQSGIAVTGTTGNGLWMYSTDGASWNVFGGVGPSSALLLNSSSFIAYDPDGANDATATFSFVAWDQTTGTASTFLVPRYADPAAGGGTSAHSAGAVCASIIVAHGNDAPLIRTNAPAISESATVVQSAADLTTADPNTLPGLLKSNPEQHSAESVSGADLSFEPDPAELTGQQGEAR